MITINHADDALKNYYLDAINAQLSGEVSPFFNAIDKTSENVFGREVKFAVANGGMEGVVAGAEDDDLPSPRANSYYGISLPLKNIYGTIEISDKAIRASGDSSGALINILNAEMDGLVASAKANFARMLYGDGNGTLCCVISKSAENVLNVNNAKSYFKGMKVKINFSNPMVTTIKSVDTVNNQITLSDNITEPAITGTPVRLYGAEYNELLGLASIFDNSTVYGYSKDDDDFFNPTVVYCTKSDLTESTLVDVIDRIEEESGGKVNMILCSHKVRKLIAGLMSDSRRIVNTSEIAAGFSSIVINDVPVYADKFCPEDRIYFINTNDFVLNQLCDWSWLEGDGGRILRQVSGKPAYSATLVKYAELLCKRPCGQGAIVFDDD